MRESKEERQDRIKNDEKIKYVGENGEINMKRKKDLEKKKDRLSWGERMYVDQICDTELTDSVTV